MTRLSVVDIEREINMKNTSMTLSALVAAMAFSGVVSAYEEGDIVVRVGVTTVVPQDSSDPIAFNGNEATLGGAELSVDNSTQLGLTVEYMLSNKWGVELLAATPFEHDADAKALSGLQVGDVKQLPPTLSAIYHFDTAENLQPYIGIGLNYTIFFDEEVTDEAQAAFIGINSGLTGADLELEDSIGLSVQIGTDYHINDNVSLNASVRWIDIETEAEITFDSGDKISADVSIDPIVYTVAVGYRF